MDTFIEVGSTWSRLYRRMTLMFVVVLSAVAVSACASGGDISGTAGMMQPQSVGGQVNHPLGGDAAGGGGGTEPALDVHVELWMDTDGDGDCDVSVATTRTDSEGLYEFDALDEGTYCVGATEDSSGAISAADVTSPVAISADAATGETVNISLD